MAGNPVFLVDNIYSDIMYPDHVVTATEEPTGYEATRVADGRRHGLNKWMATTTNSTCVVTVTCNRTRGANCLALDRGHNLDGMAIKLQGSQDAFTTTEDVLSLTVPSVPGGSIDDGCLTEEGAYIKRFDVRGYTWWRLQIPSMGATEIPEIVGMWLGMAWESRSFDFPWHDDDHGVMGSVVVTEHGWEGTSEITPRRQGTLNLRNAELDDYDEARLWLVEHFGRKRRPMWIVPDEENAANAVLAVRDMSGVWGFGFDGSWKNRRVTGAAWIEHEPQRY